MKPRDAKNSFDQLKQHIRNKTLPQIVLLYGEERYLRLQYLTKIMDYYGGKKGDMNTDMYEGKNVNVGAAIDQAETLPFLAETRVMVFHQMLESAAWGGAPVANLEEDSAFIEFFRVHLVHLLYEYGYMAGGAGIIFMGCTWISSGVKYWKSRKEYYLLPALLGAMTLGVWCNNLFCRL